MSMLYTIWKNRLQKFLDHPQALIPFLKKRFYYNFIADKQLPHYADFKYLNYTETINEIMNSNRSIIRFGDELFDMLQGIGLYYGNWRQRYHPLLAKRMEEIIGSRDQRVLICFNPEFILKKKEDFIKEGIGDQYHFWTNSKIFLKDYYHRDITYGSALCFTPRYNAHIDYQKLKDFFLTKHIIIVTSNISRFKDIHLGKTNDFIEAPGSDAWDEYETIKKKVLNLIGAKQFEAKETLILISMGSAAKVLVYDLTMLNYIAWDTGQFFDLAFKEIEKIS